MGNKPQLVLYPGCSGCLPVGGNCIALDRRDLSVVPESLSLSLVTFGYCLGHSILRRF